MSAFPGDFAAAETGIFWDMDDCKIPDELNAGEVLQRMRSTLSSSGHHGTVTINAYGDMTGLDFPSEEEVKLNHFPAGQRYAKHTQILEDIISWTNQHPEPSNLMLIVGDTSDDFVQTIKILKSMKNYRFLYVHP